MENVLPLIGIGGVARAGKNLFVSLSKEILKEKYGLSIASIAFANELKKEIDPFLLENYGISAFTSDPKEKQIIRPFLVELGKQRRLESNGQYWIDKVERYLSTLYHQHDIVLIEDTRYYNECKWIKNLGGKIIYIYRLNNNELVEPANNEEKENNPFVIEEADIDFVWKTYDLEDRKNLDLLKNKVHNTWKFLLKYD